MFKVAIWHVRPWSRIAAIAFLVVFIPFAMFLPDLLVGAIAAVVLAVGISDPFLSKRRERAPHPQPTQRRSTARSKHR
jgi:predicted PurR-regulated permease PerM